MKCCKTLALVLLAALMLAACQKPEPKEPSKQEQQEKPAPSNLKVQTNKVDVFIWTDWIYFSFKENKVVKIGDPKADKGWDIGFHITDFQLNGGESGSGQGAAVKSDLTKLTPNPKLEGLAWEQDKTGVGIKKNMFQPEDKSVPKNLSLSDQIIKYSLNSMLMPPPIEISKNVWLIKDAEGKVLEFRVVSCNWEGPSGKKTLPMKFEYAYLPESK